MCCGIPLRDLINLLLRVIFHGRMQGGALLAKVRGQVFGLLARILKDDPRLVLLVRRQMEARGQPSQQSCRDVLSDVIPMDERWSDSAPVRRVSARQASSPRISGQEQLEVSITSLPSL